MAMDKVRVYDFHTQKVSEIPAAELAPGMVEAEVKGVGRVWVSSANGQPSDKRRENLPPELMERVRKIKTDLDQVYPKTIEFWEDGFCRDMHPEKEIAIWEHIAFIYNSSKELAKARKPAVKSFASCWLVRPATRNMFCKFSTSRPSQEEQRRRSSTVITTQTPQRIEHACCRSGTRHTGW